MGPPLCNVSLAWRGGSAGDVAPLSSQGGATCCQSSPVESDKPGQQSPLSALSLDSAEPLTLARTEQPSVATWRPSLCSRGWGQTGHWRLSQLHANNNITTLCNLMLRKSSVEVHMVKRTCVSIFSPHQGPINLMRFSLLFSLLSEMSSISSPDDDLVIVMSCESGLSVQVPGTRHRNTDNIDSDHSGQYWMMILGNVMSTGCSHPSRLPRANTTEH